MGIIVDFIKQNICNTPVGDAIINEIRIRNLDEEIYTIPVIIEYFRDAANPSEEMLQIKEYYRSNIKQIQSNLKLLSDPESRICYKRAIRYRFTHNMKERPRNTANRYFVKGIVDLNKDEVFVDGGAFVGDTVKVFKKMTGDCFKKVVCFEPDSYNYKMLCRIKDARVKKINAGLWNKDDTLIFFNNGSVGSKIVTSQNKEDNTINIPVVALDNVEECQNATFIKMDIEGSEQKAIEGAKNLIRRNRPKLAICLYHTDEDMLKIIPQIHELVPDYKLYVRHHSHFAAETILYAV